jgi:hypothetical protein
MLIALILQNITVAGGQYAGTLLTALGFTLVVVQVAGCEPLGDVKGDEIFDLHQPMRLAKVVARSGIVADGFFLKVVQ